MVTQNHADNIPFCFSCLVITVAWKDNNLNSSTALNALRLFLLEDGEMNMRRGNMSARKSNLSTLLRGVR